MAYTFSGSNGYSGNWQNAGLANGPNNSLSKGNSSLVGGTGVGSSGAAYVPAPPPPTSAGGGGGGGSNFIHPLVTDPVNQSGTSGFSSTDARPTTTVSGVNVDIPVKPPMTNLPEYIAPHGIGGHDNSQQGGDGQIVLKYNGGGSSTTLILSNGEFLTPNKIANAPVFGQALSKKVQEWALKPGGPGILYKTAYGTLTWSQYHGVNPILSLSDQYVPGGNGTPYNASSILPAGKWHNRPLSSIDWNEGGFATIIDTALSYGLPSTHQRSGASLLAKTLRLLSGSYMAKWTCQTHGRNGSVLTRWHNLSDTLTEGLSPPVFTGLAASAIPEHYTTLNGACYFSTNQAKNYILQQYSSIAPGIGFMGMGWSGDTLSPQIDYHEFATLHIYLMT